MAASPLPQAIPFTCQQQEVLRALAAGASKIDAARAADVHRDTVNRWEHNVDGFAEAVRAACAEYRATLASQIRRLSGKAVDQLELIVDNPATPPSVRLRAIQLVLTRPRFPETEWALPENLNPEPIQKVQQSLQLLEAETRASMQYDELKTKNVENVESLRQQLPVTSHIPIGAVIESDENPQSNVENVELPLLRRGPTETPASDTSSKTHHSGPPQTARNAQCPCGSGQKYKRCCGKNAPPLLSAQKAAA